MISKDIALPHRGGRGGAGGAAIADIAPPAPPRSWAAPRPIPLPAYTLPHLPHLPHQEQQMQNQAQGRGGWSSPAHDGHAPRWASPQRGTPQNRVMTRPRKKKPERLQRGWATPRKPPGHEVGARLTFALGLAPQEAAALVAGGEGFPGISARSSRGSSLGGEPRALPPSSIAATEMRLQLGTWGSSRRAALAWGDTCNSLICGSFLGLLLASGRARCISIVPGPEIGERPAEVNG